MCLAVPARVVEINGDLATVDIVGNTRAIGISLTPEVQPGDYVLVHAGFAIQVIDEAEAQATMMLLEEMALLEAETEGWQQEGNSA